MSADDLTQAQAQWLRWIADHPDRMSVYYDAATGRRRWTIGIDGVLPKALEALLDKGMVRLGRPVKSRYDRQSVTLTPKGRKALQP